MPPARLPLAALAPPPGPRKPALADRRRLRLDLLFGDIPENQARAQLRQRQQRLAMQWLRRINVPFEHGGPGQYGPPAEPAATE